VPFTDVDGHWAKPEIAEAYRVGLISGYPDGSFRPDAYITRAEAVTLFNIITERCVLDSQEDLIEGAVMFPDNSDQDKWYYYEVVEATNNHNYEEAGTANYKWTGLLPKKAN